MEQGAASLLYQRERPVEQLLLRKGKHISPASQ